MKKPIEVVMLPTGLPILKGQLAILDGKTSIYSFDMKDEHPAEAQYAYVTVSQDVEPIKDDDYYLCKDNKLRKCRTSYEKSGRKIIATTDPKIYADYSTPGTTFVPEVQQSFLKEFVANPEGEWEVEYETKTLMKPADVYIEEVRTKLKLNQDNTVNITSVKEKMYSLEQMYLSAANVTHQIAANRGNSEWNMKVTPKMVVDNWLTKENL